MYWKTGTMRNSLQAGTVGLESATLVMIWQARQQRSLLGTAAVNLVRHISRCRCVLHAVAVSVLAAALVSPVNAAAFNSVELCAVGHPSLPSSPSAYRLRATGGCYHPFIGRSFSFVMRVMKLFPLPMLGSLQLHRAVSVGCGGIDLLRPLNINQNGECM
jgi:hypothetical protein